MRSWANPRFLIRCSRENDSPGLDERIANIFISLSFKDKSLIPPIILPFFKSSISESSWIFSLLAFFDVLFYIFFILKSNSLGSNGLPM